MPSDEELLQGLHHPGLLWNAPLSPTHADELLDKMDLPRAARFVDLGCGWGELLLRALATHPDSRGEGIDRNPLSIERARSSALAGGLAHRVNFVEGDVLRYSGVAERVFCVGADHAWGDAPSALARLRERVAHGGILLFGCGFWDAPPSPMLVEMFGKLPASREELLSAARSAGWLVAYSDIATLVEWDEFEEKWNQDLEELARAHASTPEGIQAQRLLDQRQREYKSGYRGVLGFVYLILQCS